MSTAFSTVLKGAALLALAVTMFMPAPALSQTPERKPMTVEDVRRMVEQGVRPQTILTALRQNCLAVYGLNQEMQRELLAAGAEPELLEGLNQVCWGAPGGPVMDPRQPFVMILEPGAWTADMPQPISVAAGGLLRLQGLAHAPAGVDRVEVNGEQVRLSTDATGGVRFTADVAVRPDMEAVTVVLYPEEGEAYRKSLPLNVAASGTAGRATATRQPYNPGSVAMSGLVPGMAQFRTGNAGMGVVILGGAGAAIAAALATETVVRCGTDADPCPSSAVLGESTNRPYLVPGLAAAAGITALGAFLGYNSARAANERAARSSSTIRDAAGSRLGQALIERLPVPTPSGGWSVSLARFHF